MLEPNILQTLIAFEMYVTPRREIMRQTLGWSSTINHVISLSQNWLKNWNHILLQSKANANKTALQWVHKLRLTVCGNKWIFNGYVIFLAKEWLKIFKSSCPHFFWLHCILVNLYLLGKWIFLAYHSLRDHLWNSASIVSVTVSLGVIRSTWGSWDQEAGMVQHTGAEVPRQHLSSLLTLKFVEFDFLLSCRCVQTPLLLLFSPQGRCSKSRTSLISYYHFGAENRKPRGSVSSIRAGALVNHHF